MTACFRGVRAVDGQIAPDSDSGNRRRRTRPHPEWNHLQAKLFLDSGIQKYLRTRPPARLGHKHKQDDGGGGGGKHVVENSTRGNHQLVIMMMPRLATVRNLSNLSSRWIHQIKRVWDDDKSLQVQWGCSSLIRRINRDLNQAGHIEFPA